MENIASLKHRIVKKKQTSPTPTLDSDNVYDLCDEYDGGRKIQAAHEKHVGHVTLEEKLTMAGSTSPCTDVSSSL